MSTSRPLLHSIAVGAASRTLVMLHGIYGRGRNWQSIAQRLIAVRPDWRALLVDLRLHGLSPAFEPPHTVLSAAEDVRALIAHVDGDGDGAEVGGVLGHSFGGKVALALARPLAAASADRPRQIWIIDSTPEAKPPVGTAWDMLLHVRSLPASFAARADLVAGLGHFGWPEGVAQWMATNLRYVDGRYEWALDFDAMAAMLESFFHTDLWDVVEHPPANLQLHFVKAIGSNTLPEPACARILRAGAANGQVHLHRLEGSHWLNSDNPQGIVDLLSTHLARERD
jgi:pimeloyl-ACP methyl ester carboxylesterase